MPNLENERVLIIDDNKSATSAFTRQLVHWGAGVVMISPAKETVSATKCANGFTMIFIDSGLHQSGYQIAAEIVAGG
jgi:CheY-like chemotaxis protein